MKMHGSVLLGLACLGLLAFPAWGATLIVTNANDSGVGSLRQAINQANINAEADTIIFQIPSVSGPVTIFPLQEFVLGEPFTTIDGYTQLGSAANTNPPPQPLNARLMVSINGSRIQGGVAVFRIETNHTILRGLNINFGPVYDIVIGWQTPTLMGNQVQGCFVGTDISGTLAMPSGWAGFNPPACVGVMVMNGALRNIIGTNRDNLDDFEERNLISGEATNSGGQPLSGFGVLLYGAFREVISNQVNGNLIGTNLNVDRPLPNNYGIGLINGASDNIIAGNVIAGNNSYGLWAEQLASMVGTPNNRNQIQRNFIGINPNTDKAIPNRLDGLHLGPGCNDFNAGMLDWNYANLISGNGRHGVWISGSRTADSAGNTFVYNIVGLDTSGAFAVPNGGPNGGDGFHLEGTLGGNTIGTTDSPNLISGNFGNGIALVNSNSNLVGANWVGRNFVGDDAQPNQLDGITISCGAGTGVACSSGNTITDNQVFGNTGHGISLLGNITNNQIAPNNIIQRNGSAGIRCLMAGDTNTIANNTIQGNGSHGIDMEGSSVRIVSNSILSNGGVGVVDYPYFGSSASPTTAADDVVSRPMITFNNIDGNASGGVFSLDTEPANGSTLDTDNTIGNNNGNVDVLQLWAGAVEILDNSYTPIVSGAYTVSLENSWGDGQTGNVPDGGLWGPTGFAYNYFYNWFFLVGYYVDTAGNFYNGNPHTVTVVGPTGGVATYTFDGVADDLSLGGQPAGIMTGGLFRYQVAEVVTYVDSDGDGVPDNIDCAPNDPKYQGGSPGTSCDADGDGYCNNAITGVVQQAYCPNDICFGGLCAPTDCDDTDINVNPGVAELSFGNPICIDGVDNDCDGLIDGADPGCFQCITDADCNDNDVCNGTEKCQLNLCLSGTPLNCNDGNLCTDDNCNPSSGCLWVPNSDPCNDGYFCTVNDVCSGGSCGGTPRDCSAFSEQCNQGVCNESAGRCEAQPADEGLPCDDGRYCNVGETCQTGVCTGGGPYDCSPVADQCNIGICNEDTLECDRQPTNQGLPCDDNLECSMDDSCNGGVCAGLPLDADRDTFVAEICSGNDCNDSEASIHPGAEEVCDDGIDQDCNGFDLQCDCPDADSDGFKDQTCGGLDCDDSNANINPNAAEVCNDTVDNDCDGFIDGNDPDCICLDTDGDGYLDQYCGGDDCNDSDASIHPGAEEVCDDGIDQDCNGFDLQCDCPDADSDGFKDQTCGGLDCDDSNADINPDAAEVCLDGVDNNCDGTIDQPDCVCPDADSDGFTDERCGGTDCNDSDAEINLNTEENCADQVDNDCDGLVDLEDEVDCGRGKASGCNCATSESSAAGSFLGLLGLLLLSRRRR